MSFFESSDFDVFYSDFVTPATIAGVTGFEVIFTKQELETESGYGIFPVFRSHREFKENDIVVIRPDDPNPEYYTIRSIRPLEHNEYLHILRNVPPENQN